MEGREGARERLVPRLGEREKFARGERVRDRTWEERGGEGLTQTGEEGASGSGERETRCVAG